MLGWRGAAQARRRAGLTVLLDPSSQLPGCRVQRSGESVWLVALTRIKVIHSGIHLVLKDAIRGPARCPADNEHAPTANIDPDGIRLIGGSSAHWSARRTAGPSLAPPTHRGHLRQLRAQRQPALPDLSQPLWQQPEPRGGVSANARAAQPFRWLSPLAAPRMPAASSGF